MVFGKIRQHSKFPGVEEVIKVVGRKERGMAELHVLGGRPKLCIVGKPFPLQSDILNCSLKAELFLLMKFYKDFQSIKQETAWIHEA